MYSNTSPSQNTDATADGTIRDCNKSLFQFVQPFPQNHKTAANLP